MRHCSPACNNLDKVLFKKCLFVHLSLRLPVKAGELVHGEVRNDYVLVPLLQVHVRERTPGESGPPDEPAGTGWLVAERLLRLEGATHRKPAAAK